MLNSLVREHTAQYLTERRNALHPVRRALSAPRSTQNDVVEAVRQALGNAPGFVEDDARSIMVVMNVQVLELHGNVRTAWHATTAEQIARRLVGSSQVRNLLVIDTVLMLQLDRMLRCDLQFDIDDLRVTVTLGVAALQGRTATAEQAAYAYQVVRQRPGVRVVLNLLETTTPVLSC